MVKLPLKQRVFLVWSRSLYSEDEEAGWVRGSEERGDASGMERLEFRLYF